MRSAFGGGGSNQIKAKIGTVRVSHSPSLMLFEGKKRKTHSCTLATNLWQPLHQDRRAPVQLWDNIFGALGCTSILACAINWFPRHFSLPESGLRSFGYVSASAIIWKKILGGCRFVILLQSQWGPSHVQVEGMGFYLVGGGVTDTGRDPFRSPAMGVGGNTVPARWVLAATHRAMHPPARRGRPWRRILGGGRPGAEGRIPLPGKLIKSRLRPPCNFGGRLAALVGEDEASF